VPSDPAVLSVCVPARFPRLYAIRRFRYHSTPRTTCGPEPKTRSAPARIIACANARLFPRGGQDLAEAFSEWADGQMDAALKQSLAETTESGFAKYLTDSNAAVKGIAISEPQPLTDREVKVRVEYVYQDRNEAQTMYLEKGTSGWKIARVDGAERVKTLVPYGTPVQ